MEKEALFLLVIMLSTIIGTYHLTTSQFTGRFRTKYIAGDQLTSATLIPNLISPCFVIHLYDAQNVQLLTQDSIQFTLQTIRRTICM